MAGYSSLAQAMHAMLVSVAHGSSRHRKARVQRFIFRHPQAHRAILGKIIRAQQDHQREVHTRFAEMRKRKQQESVRVHGGKPWERRAHRG